MKATVSEEGRVRIPKRIRDRLGIMPGDVLDFDEEAGRLVARKSSSSDRITELYGTLTLPEPVDEFLRQIRGPLGAPYQVRH